MPRPRHTDIFGGRSPWVSIYEARYKSQGMDSWTNERVYALCGRIGCQVEDLAAYAGETRNGNVKRYLKENRWPVPLVLHFWKLDRYISGLHSPDMQDMTLAQMLARAPEAEEAHRG